MTWRFTKHVALFFRRSETGKLSVWLRYLYLLFRYGLQMPSNLSIYVDIIRVLHNLYLWRFVTCPAFGNCRSFDVIALRSLLCFFNSLLTSLLVCLCRLYHMPKVCCIHQDPAGDIHSCCWTLGELILSYKKQLCDVSFPRHRCNFSRGEVCRCNVLLFLIGIGISSKPVRYS